MRISYYDVDEEVYKGTYDSLPHIPRIGEEVVMGTHPWYPEVYQVVKVSYGYMPDENTITISIKKNEEQVED